MVEQTHILNKSVFFTEIPGGPKLPAKTILNIKFGHKPECFVTAITPSGQTYEFKSLHIANLLNSPWVSKVGPGDSVSVATPDPVAPELNPYMIGDVAPVSDIAKDTLPTIDVTGISAEDPLPPKPKAKVAAEESAVLVDATEPALDVTGISEKPAKVVETVVDLGESTVLVDTNEPAIDVTGTSDETVKSEKKSRKK